MYTCPMHPEVRHKLPGVCPKCGMQLVKKSHVILHVPPQVHAYRPFIVIIFFLCILTYILSLRDSFTADFSWVKTMSYFMGSFFFVFSGFKFMDLDGFVNGYVNYDVLAKKIREYAYIYPFLELLFGIGYILAPQWIFLNIVVFLVMTFSGIGVLQSILSKRKFQCACLGTFLKIPLTKITLVEDFVMAAMAIAMLVLH